MKKKKTKKVKEIKPNYKKSIGSFLTETPVDIKFDIKEYKVVCSATQKVHLSTTNSNVLIGPL